MEKTDRLEVRIEPALGSALDEWRRGQKDIPTRSEAVRRIVAAVIAKRGEKAK
jgi:metal-responsive CopG/Arc/MetJ family transcriptional regulator